MTYEEILEEMLSRVPEEVDRREGSIIYDTLAPIAFELASYYNELEGLYDLFFADTAVGEWLDRVTKQFGIARQKATCAVREGTFTASDGSLFDVPIGSRFAINEAVFQVTRKISDGKFQLTAEEAGRAGNLYEGALLPIDNIEGLAAAVMGEVLVFGKDSESDDAFRDRFFNMIERQPFAGNVGAYEEAVLSFSEAGAVKVFPIWNGPGTVKLVVGNENGRAVGSAVVEKIQEHFMPLNEAGLGTGLAPIGHTVTVSSATNVSVDITANIVLDTGHQLEALRSSISESVEREIGRMGFSDSILHISKIAVAILSVEGVLDVTDIAINGHEESLVLEKTATSYQVPVFQTLTLSEV